MEAYDVGFGPDREPPADADQKDEYDFIKRKLERKISEVSPDPNTITAVTERYCDFNSIRPGTRSKYRRELARLIAITGDVPIAHVRTEHLRLLRDKLIGEIKPASIQAVFTPIISILNYAFDEELLDTNPMACVRLPRDKRRYTLYVRHLCTPCEGLLLTYNFNGQFWAIRKLVQSDIMTMDRNLRSKNSGFMQPTQEDRLATTFNPDENSSASSTE